MTGMFEPSHYKTQLIKENIAAYHELQELRKVVEQLRTNYKDSKEACPLDRYWMLKDMISLTIDSSRKENDSQSKNVFATINILQITVDLKRELQGKHKLEIWRSTDKMKKQIKRIRSLERKYDNSKQLCCLRRYGAMKRMIKETVWCLNDDPDDDYDGRETDPLLS